MLAGSTLTTALGATATITRTAIIMICAKSLAQLILHTLHLLNVIHASLLLGALHLLGVVPLCLGALPEELQAELVAVVVEPVFLSRLSVIAAPS